MKLAEFVMLARVMSSRYNVSVQMSTAGEGAKACCQRATDRDGKVQYIITIPLLESQPKWDASIRGYLDHEIGHVRYTDFTVCPQDQLTQNILNILEDVRIEKRMGDDYPGARGNLRALARSVFTMDELARLLNDWEKSCSDGIQAAQVFMNMLLAWVLYNARGHVDPAIDKLCDPLRKVVEAMYSRRPEDLVRFNKVGELSRFIGTSTEDCGKRAIEIAGWIVDLNNAHKQDQVRKVGDTSPGGEFRKGESRDLAQQMVRQWEKDGTAQVKSAAGGDPASVVPTDMGDALTRALAMDDAKGKEREANRDCCVNGGRPTPTIALGNLQREMDVLKDDASGHWSGTYTVQELTEQYKLDKISLVQSALSRMIPPLLQSALYKPAQVGYSGRLFSHALHRVGVGDGRIFNRRAERKAQAIDATLLLDTSGSMKDKCLDIYTVCLAMLRMLKRLPNVRVAAETFSTVGHMTLAKFDTLQVKDRLPVPRGGTPTGGAVTRAVFGFPVRQDVRRVIFVLTDGLADSQGSLEVALDVAKYHDIEVYGLGVGAGAAGVKNSFPAEYYAWAETIEEFPGELARLMKTALLRAVA